MKIFFNRSRSYKKNDQATIESKNNHLVRRYAFYYRYDTGAEKAVLNRLWKLVNDLTPTIKPTGYASKGNGQRSSLCNKPMTPLGRLLAGAGALTGPRIGAARLPARASTPPRSPASPPRSPARSLTCKTGSSYWPGKRPDSSTSPPCPTSTKASGPKPPDIR
jgi:hypothetical protein